MKENFQANVDSYVVSFIRFHLIACSTQRYSINNVFGDLVFFTHCKIMGMLVANTGFEDIVYQSGVYSSGSIKGVLAGTNYNKAWIVHSGTICYLRLLSHAVYY